MSDIFDPNWLILVLAAYGFGVTLPHLLVGVHFWWALVANTCFLLVGVKSYQLLQERGQL